MSSIYANTGADIDLIFTTGTGASEVGIIDDTGQDIGYKFTAGSADWDTGLVAASGQDIGRILGGEITRLWYSETTAVSSASATESAGWSRIAEFKETSSDWTKDTSNTAGTLGIGAHGETKKGNKYSSYAFHIVLAGTDVDVSASLSAAVDRWGKPSSDGKVWLTEIRTPKTGVKNFVVCGYGGWNTYTTYETIDGEGTEVENPSYSYTTLTITMKVSGVVARTYTVKWRY